MGIGVVFDCLILGHNLIGSVRIENLCQRYQFLAGFQVHFRSSTHSMLLSSIPGLNNGMAEAAAGISQLVVAVVPLRVLTNLG